MCPLRIVLIFLSATLAGFFVLRGLKQSNSDDLLLSDDNVPTAQSCSDSSKTTIFSKVKLGFWTCVDMASGKYLWSHLVSSTTMNSEKKNNKQQ